MKKNYTNEWLRAFLAIFFILGIGATFFLFSNELKESAEKAKIITKKSELTGPSNETIAQKSILDSLNILKLEYDVALLEKTSLSEQLELERKNVQNLMEIIKVSKNPSIVQIQIYRKQLLDLKTALAAKIVEIKNLKSQNKSLLTEIESQNVVMYKQKTENDTLLLHQKKLELAIKDAAKLSLSNFKVAAFREKKSGKELETEKARNAQKLKVSFSVNGNSIAKTGKRVFYIQVLDQKNTVLGENKLIEFENDKALVYSFIVAVDFQGKPLNAYGVLNSDGNEFKKGTYFVNFFDKQEIMGSASVTLE
ncbi:hypothetical protein [Flavobacterium johnsoniae]|uniref:Chromosome partitioning protein ParA n=1 Tax=Flavobacterium johnsoniae (strain ATCC 17061 / DSM 2064 / JCM 8514 / BCRC 14874 / CCUG 350202 / NBRC 14942 / NCIMB 11054 / UW101) TaxID=376686 RepID=A5FKR0_FLAJ1|nr:hypothetical protein [Flavobacterium johnsoniae]ABQ04218.1 hypothetical protein Fjoh_1186 [Flavobacterium johnsoniae UW101]OXG02551.1 hypothetical protein B0A63_02525 [Flavobacterium johnsoniae UW101]WQG83987.1 hypothetical protein SR927_12850 [Flavobacterium johnsoniae UW101]SHK16061.1 hypothetical protein SAMN05444146_0607 [Flavobacterium johnsoniae]